VSPRSAGTTARRRGSSTRHSAPNAERAATPVQEATIEDGPIEGPRRGARKTMMHYIRQLPNYLRLLMGLMTDPRVSGMDKLIVAGAIAYIVMPFDFIPDFIPFLGEVDDVYLLVLALQRLIGNAGRTTLLAHWSGAPEDLADMNLRAVFSAAAFFLPAKIRRRLRGLGR